MRTMSDSLRWVTRWLCPGARRSRSGWMSASDSGRRGGPPSITAPMAAPWDSPQVVTRNRWPKVLPMCVARVHHNTATGAERKTRPASVGGDQRREDVADLAAEHDVGEVIHRGRLRIDDHDPGTGLLRHRHDTGDGIDRERRARGE